MNNHKHSKSGVGHSAYYSWMSMKARCYNKNYSLYHRYGGRGIMVCDRWRESFDNFIKDVGDKPSIAHSLDRYPNNDGNYEASNCRWATKKQQAGNTSKNKWIEYGGKKMILTDWAVELNIDVKKLHYHLKSWTIGEIVTMINNGGIINKKLKPYNKVFYKNPARAMLGAVGSKSCLSKKVKQIDKKTGMIIEIHESITQAEIKTKTSNINKVLKGVTKSAGGYKWQYA